MLQPFHLSRRECHVFFEKQIQDEEIIVGGGNGIQKCCLTGKAFAIKEIQEVLGIAQTDDVLRVLVRGCNRAVSLIRTTKSRIACR